MIQITPGRTLLKPPMSGKHGCMPCSILALVPFMGWLKFKPGEAQSSQHLSGLWGMKQFSASSPSTGRRNAFCSPRGNPRGHLSCGWLLRQSLTALELHTQGLTSFHSNFRRLRRSSNFHSHSNFSAHVY